MSTASAPATTTTFRTAAEIILANIEPTEPQNTILLILQELDGKLLRNSLPCIIEDKLTNIYPNTNWHCYITKNEYSGTDLTVRQVDEYRRVLNNTDVTLKLSRKSTHVKIDCEFIINENARYFAALAERNARRMKLLQQTIRLQLLDHDLQAFVALRSKLKIALNHEDIDSDKYRIMEEYGIDPATMR